MIPLSTKPGISPQFLIRGAEVVLVVALALALADFAWLQFPQPGDKQPSALAPADQGVPVQPAAIALSGNGTSRNLSPVVLGLFGQSESAASEPVFVAEKIKETALDLTLKGILARRGSGRKFALIAQGGDQEKVYRLGDRIAGAEITHIEARRIILLRNGNRESLALETAEPRRGSSFTKKGVTGRITTISDHEQIVSRNLFDRQMQRLPEVLSQARAAPYWDKNGHEAGFRVVDIEPGSVFDELGLLQEDVIVTVNGVSVRNNQEALTAYQSFKSADALQIGLLRDGREVTVDYSIQ